MKLAIFAFVSSAFVASAAITGKLTVTYENAIVAIKGDLTGLPTSVTGGGIHVHAGTDCTNGGKTTDGDVNAHVGGHLFSKYIDGFAYPVATTYSTDADGKGKIDISAKYFVGAKAKNTDDMPSIEGRCIVMHGVSSTKKTDRAAIGKIVVKDPAYTAVMGKYPGTALTTTPSGALTVTVDADGNVKLKGDLEGLGKSLVDVGIHIHTGEDCTDKDKVGGHLYSKGDGFETTKYTSDDKGAAKVDIATPASAYTLLTSAATAKVPAVENHCIVIHDGATKRVAIGQIKCNAGKCEAAMGAYPTAATATTAAAGSTAAAKDTTAAAKDTTAAAKDTTAPAKDTTAKIGSATQTFTAFSALVACAVLAF